MDRYRRESRGRIRGDVTGYERIEALCERIEDHFHKAKKQLEMHDLQGVTRHLSQMFRLSQKARAEAIECAESDVAPQWAIEAADRVKREYEVKYEPVVSESTETDNKPDANVPADSDDRTTEAQLIAEIESLSGISGVVIEYDDDPPSSERFQASVRPDRVWLEAEGGSILDALGSLRNLLMESKR